MDIDINSDVGEGSPADADIIPLVTSVNIACGYHAGDASSMWKTLDIAAKHGVRCGAHPGFPDREHFGRQELPRTDRQVFEDCVYQIGALIGVAKAVGTVIRHIKPHGALYNLACRDDAVATPIVKAAVLYGMPVVGMPGSRLEAACDGRCTFVAEGFADRRYLPDGNLVRRSDPTAMISDSADAVRQTEWLITQKGIRTICVHGDTAHALEFVQALRAALTAAGHRIVPFDAQ